MAVRPFRFGVTAPTPAAGTDWIARARRVEQLGYSILVVPDHFRDHLAPVPALTAAALATTRLRVGSLVFSNDFRHPAGLARDAATIDVLSGGRFELGLGAGWLREEYDQTGIPFDAPGTRIERLEEAVTIMKKLLAGERVTFAGRHYTIADLEGRPASVQRPHPPIAIGGGGRRTLTLAAREATIIGLVLRARRDGGGLELADLSDGRDPGEARVGPSRRRGSLRLARAQRADPGGRGRPISGAWRWISSRPGSRCPATSCWRPPTCWWAPSRRSARRFGERRERYGISYLTVFERDMEAFAPVVARLAGT